MINREITYKRDVNNSYMIIPAMPEESFDEKRMLRGKIEGIVPVEKCYVASVGQYWYDITGKQALDGYCRIHSVNRVFFENFMLRLCNIIETLEWNLIDVNCLVLDPELVFLNSFGDEIFGVIYPFHKSTLLMELQQLMEFLLSKLDHTDMEAVGCAYKIYEMTVSESVSVQEIKEMILEEQAKRVKPEIVSVMTREHENTEKEKEPVTILQSAGIEDYPWIKELLSKGKALVQKYFPKQNKEVAVVYPEEEEREEKKTPVIHPTVCITPEKSPEYHLFSERKDMFPDYELGQESCIVGKNPNVKIRIEKDTISQFHARIEVQGGKYYIEDLNSTNGTYVNEQMLDYKVRRPLERGDRIRFADVRYQFY